MGELCVELLSMLIYVNWWSDYNIVNATVLNYRQGILCFYALKLKIKHKTKFYFGLVFFTHTNLSNKKTYQKVA